MDSFATKTGYLLAVRRAVAASATGSGRPGHARKNSCDTVCPCDFLHRLFLFSGHREDRFQDRAIMTISEPSPLQRRRRAALALDCRCSLDEGCGLLCIVCRLEPNDAEYFLPITCPT